MDSELKTPKFHTTPASQTASAKIKAGVVAALERMTGSSRKSPAQTDVMERADPVACVSDLDGIIPVSTPVKRNSPIRSAVTAQEDTKSEQVISAIPEEESEVDASANQGALAPPPSAASVKQESVSPPKSPFPYHLRSTVTDEPLVVLTPSKRSPPKSKHNSPIQTVQASSTVADDKEPSQQEVPVSCCRKLAYAFALFGSAVLIATAAVLLPGGF